MEARLIHSQSTVTPSTLLICVFFCVVSRHLIRIAFQLKTIPTSSPLHNDNNKNNKGDELVSNEVSCFSAAARA
jgi:hypothetical protein